MRTIAAADAETGDIVAEPVINDQGRTLLPKGARLSAAVISRLPGWGVEELRIEGEDEAPVTAEASPAEGSTDLLEALDHRFSAWEEDATMMRIKAVARRHLSTLGS